MNRFPRGDQSFATVRVVQPVQVGYAKREERWQDRRVDYRRLLEFAAKHVRTRQEETCSALVSWPAFERAVRADREG